jgi:AraC-like DNA-binding protein
LPFGFTLWSIILNAMAIGAIGVFVTAVAMRRRAGPVRWPALAACISGICWLLTNSAIIELLNVQAPFFVGALTLIGAPVVALFWILLLVLFEDVRPTPFRLAPVAIIIVIYAIRDYAPWPSVRNVAHWVFLLTCTALALHAIYIVAKGWRGDLVEARRRLRTPLLLCFGVAALVILLILATNYLGWFGLYSLWMNTLTMIAVALTATVLSGMMVEARSALFVERTAKPTKEPEDDADAAMQRKLEKLMTQEEAWRQENLSVTDLAAKVGVPEYRLRKLINGRLGHRNFAAFVNAHRIEAAKARLSDPANSRIAVSQIAFDLGFSSLGPFNRAFKEAVGQTPTQWRRQSQGGIEGQTLAADDKGSPNFASGAEASIPARRRDRNQS